MHTAGNILIKNIYDENTTDTLRQLNQNLIALMKRSPDYQHITITQFSRVPSAVGSNKTQIRVDLAKDATKSFFFLSEEFLTRLEENDEIRLELNTVMKQIKTAFERKA